MILAAFGWLALLMMSAGTSAYEETCTSRDLNYTTGFQFNSNKQGGAVYSCTCYGRMCVRISCTRTRNPTPSPPTTVQFEDNDPNEIIGVIPEEQGPVIIQPTVVLPAVPNTVAATSGSCFDSSSLRSYVRGEVFVKSSGTSRPQYCTCPRSGRPQITCTNRLQQCSLPDPPQRVVSTPIGNGCFDSWNNREYRSGSTYYRSRSMSQDGRIRGRYSCTCDSGMMRCSAVDIPCCNQATGEYVSLNERFLISRQGQVWNCRCLRQRGRYSNCIRASGNNPTSQRSRYHPIGRNSQCVDKFTRRSYAVGSRWYQARTNGTYQCRCERTRRGSSNVLRSICSYVRA